jgi:hypothetical protein
MPFGGASLLDDAYVGEHVEQVAHGPVGTGPVDAEHLGRPQTRPALPAGDGVEVLRRSARRRRRARRCRWGTSGRGGRRRPRSTSACRGRRGSGRGTGGRSAAEAEPFEDAGDPGATSSWIGDELAGAGLDRFGGERGDGVPLLVGDEDLGDGRAGGLERAAESGSQPGLEHRVERQPLGEAVRASSAAGVPGDSQAAASQPSQSRSGGRARRGRRGDGRCCRPG